jgi:RNA polymerase sigma factor (sigma-70 family)
MEAVVLMEVHSDHAVFSRMAREHHRMLRTYARTLIQDEEDVRDLVQESLVAAWKNLKHFDVTRDTGAWLRGIVRNKWRDQCRKSGRQPQFADAELGDREAQFSAWESEKTQPIFESLQECREKLPEAYAEAVRVVYYEGMRGAEAAKLLNVNAATLRKRLERARAALYECLNAKGSH